MKFLMLANILVMGLLNGCVYALLAAGFSLIFGVGRILHLTHTAYYMLAAYIIFYLVGAAGVPPVLALFVSVAVTTICGVFLYRLVIEPVREHETTVLIMTIALAMFFQEIMLLIFGGHYRGVPPMVGGALSILGVKVTYQYILSLVTIVIVLVAVWLILSKTRLGVALRATAQDREVANLMGIDVGLTAVLAMLIAVALAAVAGAVVSPLYVLEPAMWAHPLVVVLAVVIVGGLGSMKGSVVAAFILSFAETLVVFLVPNGAFLRGAFSLLVMLAVLMFRPEGLFGVFFEGER
ncbi:MAG: branched-chain amino acid ABC transporter permease [Desulfotomaculales bacterium]